MTQTRAGTRRFCINNVMSQTHECCLKEHVTAVMNQAYVGTGRSCVNNVMWQTRE
jgi:hypothetical protein